MTQTRSWLALGALLAAIVGGTVWAAGKEKPAATIDPGCEIRCEGVCLDTTDKKCGTEEKAKTCCEGKCCAAEKGKACCGDGKCCGCCEKAKEKTITLPVPAGAAVQVMVEPVGPGTAYERAYEVPFAPPPLPYVSTPPVPQPGCGSAWCPVSPFPPAPPPAPMAQYTPVTQCVPAPCVMPPPMPVSPVFSPWRVQVIELNHQPRLTMQWAGDKETRVSCEEMTVHIGPEPLKVAVADKQVHVSGNFVEGSADIVTRNTADGSLLMEGHVRLHYGKEGKKVEVAAEDVVVGIADGRVEVRGLACAARPQPVTAPQAVTPACTTPTSCPACPASGDDCHHIFNFWTGFFH